MKRAFAISILLTLLAGCHTDIVTTAQLKAIENKCVHIELIESQDPYAGKVLRDMLEKEFVRKQVQLCDANTANIIITGSSFTSYRSAGKDGMFGSRESAAEAIEAISLTARDSAGNVLLTASYDNSEQLTAGKLAREFGSALAGKLK